MVVGTLVDAVELDVAAAASDDVGAGAAVDVVAVAGVVDSISLADESLPQPTNNDTATVRAAAAAAADVVDLSRPVTVAMSVGLTVLVFTRQFFTLSFGSRCQAC